MKRALLIIGVITILSACQKDLLEQAPNNKISTENFIPDLALTGVYDGLQNQYTGIAFQWQMGYSPLASNRSDADAGAMGRIESGIGLDPSTSGFQQMWDGLYKLVFRANFYLDNVKPIKDFDQETIEIYKGEAKFIRAYAYSQLAAFYGSVPLQLNSAATVSELRQMEKSSKSAIIEQVLLDLDDAIEVLPEDADKGRVTIGAALALKARVQLREGQFQDVLDLTNEIIEMDKYALFGETETGVFEDEAYKNLFKLEDEGNEEVVFDIQYVGPNQYEGNPFESYGGFKPIRDGWIRFWGTKYLVDQYENLDGSPIDNSPYDVDDDRFYEKDYRFEATITFPGQEIWNGDIWGPGYRIYTRAKTGFLMTKFVLETDNIDEAGIRDSPLNYILIRYADVLLMNAEAQIELNQISNDGEIGAEAIINRIRARGGLQPVADNSIDGLRTAVRKERMIEFAGEGLYMFDIRRWGIADVEMERDVERYDGVVTHERTFSEKLLEWAIPQQDIDNSEGLVQNPLWN
jgi:hypothetical protein